MSAKFLLTPVLHSTHIFLTCNSYGTFFHQTSSFCFPPQRERLNEWSSGEPLSSPPGIKCELIIQRGTNLLSVYINTGRQMGLKWYHYFERAVNVQATFAHWGHVNVVLRVTAAVLLIACSYLNANSIFQCQGTFKTYRRIAMIRKSSILTDYIL